MLDKVRRVILKYRGKREFFQLIARHFGSGTPEYKLIESAYKLAKNEFYFTWRHDGTRYFYHLVAVAVIVLEYMKITSDVNLIAAALLHDLVEDKPKWTTLRVTKKFNSDVAHLVEAVTKPDPKLYGSNIHKHEKATFAKVRAGGYRAIKLKLADRLHNMITLWGSAEKKLQKTRETLRYVMPLAIEIDVLWKELNVACALHSGEGNPCLIE